MGKRLNLGIVGCGDIAGFTALVSRLVRQVRLVACCDTNHERARTFAAKHAIPNVFTDFSVFLNMDGLDAVYLALPHHLHANMILSAAEMGLHVLVEKPLTRTMAEGIDVIKRLRGTSVKIGVNYQYRYDTGCYAMARAVQSGKLGKVFSVNIQIPWHREKGYFEQAGWHKTIAQAGGGTLITQGSHFLDIAMWALSEPPVSAIGITGSPGFDVEVDTLAHGIVEMRSGALVAVSSTMAAAVEEPARIDIFGDKGTAHYMNSPMPSLKFIGAKVHRAPPPQSGVHALHRSLAAFANWVLDDQLYLTPAESTLTVLAAVDAIYRSARSGGRVKIDFD